MCRRRSPLRPLERTARRRAKPRGACRERDERASAGATLAAAALGLVLLSDKPIYLGVHYP
jgi:hypothetical protein